MSNNNLGVYRNLHTLGKLGMPVEIDAIVSGYLRTSLSLDIFSLLLTVITTSSISGGISLQHKIHRTAQYRTLLKLITTFNF